MCKVRYIDVIWKHDFEDLPIRLVSEIAIDGFETRKLEFFKSGSVTFASVGSQTGDTRLGEAVVPEIEEINHNPEFSGKEISHLDFETLWKLHTENGKDHE